MTKNAAEQAAKDDAQVHEQQAPDAQQPGVTLASQDWERYREETPAAQSPANPTAFEPSPIKADAPPQYQQ